MAHAAQYKKEQNNPVKKCRRPTLVFLQRRQMNGQEAHEKVLNIAHY